MKAKGLLMLAVLICMVGLTSCQSKEERVISKMEGLAERIDRDGESFEKEDWEAILKEYQQLQTEAMDCEFSSEQLKELCRVEGKLTAVMTRESAKSFGRSIGDLLQNGKQVLQGVFDGINENLKTEE